MNNTIGYDTSYLEAVKKGYWNDLNDRYSISKFGTVYDKERDRIVIPYLSNGGYELISIKDNGKWRIKGVHQLVWEAFNGKIPEGYEINHISEDKTDNSLSNLNLLTHRANMRWGPGIERASKARINHKLMSKPVIQKTLQGEVIKVWPSVMEIQRQFGYKQGNISKCCRGIEHYNTAYGYIWEYTEEKAVS